MAITTASVEANGWVLRLRLTATPGSFANYALDPGGTPRVTLACVHPGFAPSAGTAVATPRARAVVATKPLRRPVNPAAPTIFTVDETDHGDGTITVRLALSEYVHATETGVTLSVAAGWRSGETAAAAIAVTNDSTFVAAKPIFRWADVPYQRVTGGFALELIAFSHHPQGLSPVAGVKFTVTDGTTIRTAWATALTSSTRYGDAARVYSVTIDPAAATALTAGLLRCDAEVYPWLGAMRTTDAAGTRSMAALNLAGYASKAEAPFVVAHDPAGTRYGGQVLFVDPAGTATASVAMVKPDLASARALAVASRPRDITTAIQAAALLNRTLTAANGGAVATRAVDGLRIVLAAGIHVGAGTTAVTSGTTTSEVAVTIEGDPDDANPRANVVLQNAAAASTIRASRVALRNLRWEIGTTTLFSSGAVYYWLDNIEVRGKTGSETSGIAPIAAATPAASFNLAATRTRWWRTGNGLSGTTLRFGVLRNCEFARRSDALALIGGRFIPATEDGFVTGVQLGAGAWNSSTDIGALEDVILTGIDLRSQTGRVWAPGSVAAATAGTPNPSIRRQVFANNLCERFGVDPQPFWSMGEDASATMSYNIVEGNSFVGERCNLLYSDPLPATNADTNSQLNQAFGNRIANNSFDWAATKHDAFNDPQTQAVRNAAGVPSPNGYRPQMVETWSILYGVGFESNYDYGRHTSAGNFQFEYFGRRSLQAVAGLPAWPADRSTFGSPATGGGTYKPPAGSLLLARALRGNSDRDRSGAVRTPPFASGSVDTESVIQLSPANARSAHRAASPIVRVAVTLVAAGARHAQRARSPAVAWTGTLIPDPARLFVTSVSPSIGVVAGVALLSPANARHRLTDAGVAVLPDLIFATPRLVRIEGEVRVQLITSL